MGLLGILSTPTDKTFLRIAWISGWTIPAPTLRAQVQATWPDAQHEVFEPGANAIASVRASSADMLAGFSLGAHLLLTVDDPRPRILLAPFVDLKKEAKLGGAIATTQLRQQLRWLKRDPIAAIADFRERIGSGAAPSDEFGNLDSLLWGLEQMLAPGKVPITLPKGSLAVAGQDDPLLDITALRHAIPSLHVVTACRHQLQPLLAVALHLRKNSTS